MQIFLFGLTFLIFVRILHIYEKSTRYLAAMVTTNPRHDWNKACRRLLRPIARMLLRAGITWKEFSELAKQSFVEVAGNDYGLAGRPTNASRVALMTGLSRREVKRVRDLLEAEEAEMAPQTSKIARILSGWHQDPDFVDADGNPKVLAADGDRSSFASLLDRYAGDLPAVAITKELLRLKLIEHSGKNGFRVLQRSYTGSATDPDILRQMSTALHDHGQTLAWNIDAERTGPTRFERMAFNANMSRRAVDNFQRLITERGQAFLEDIDAWLSEHEPEEMATERADQIKLGVGVYLVMDDEN